MTKQEMQKTLSAKLSATKNQAEVWLNGYAHTVIQALKSEGEAVLPGLGKLVLVTRNARKGINPRNGDEIDIPERTAVKFKAFKPLKDSING